MSTDYKKAIEESKKILETFGVESPPVPLDDIVSSYGLNIVFADFSSIKRGSEIAGFIDFDNKKIVVNKDDPPNRQRFTIAHELGHYILHTTYVQNKSEYKVLLRRPIKEEGYSKEEKEANCFAAYLLVPTEILKKYKDLPNSINATLFVVSEDVIRFSKKRAWA
jgi:Zn-dependent peptidase ImmA (M78 family)